MLIMRLLDVSEDVSCYAKNRILSIMAIMSETEKNNMPVSIFIVGDSITA